MKLFFIALCFVVLCFSQVESNDPITKFLFPPGFSETKAHRKKRALPTDYSGYSDYSDYSAPPPTEYGYSPSSVSSSSSSSSWSPTSYYSSSPSAPSYSDPTMNETIGL